MGKLGAVMAIALFGGASVLGGCAADPSDADGEGGRQRNSALMSEPSNKISGSVSEWAVHTTANSAYAGDVTFAITNFGTITHEFLVVKTDFEPGMIPLGAENRFDEKLKGVDVVDEIAEFPVNTTGLLKVSLEPGKYQLLCNIAGHYKAGMWMGFDVLESEKPVVDAPPAESTAVSNDISGSVSEWKVDVNAMKANAGDVNFTIENKGTIDHEFLVVKTDYEPGKIPLGENNRFDEEDKGLSVVDEIPEWAAGTTGTLKVKLEPGKYQLLCNIAGHYKNGMWKAFEVLPAGPASGAAGADADAVSNDVNGSVTEWNVNLDAVKAKAGDVTFTIENRGTIDHEFLVVKTTYGHGMIPLGENNRFDEEDKGISVIDEIKEWPAGKTGTLKVKLEPGKYELLCNIEGHYKNGMHAPFEVLE